MAFVAIPSVRLDDVRSDYGDATQGSVTSGATETFALSDGNALTVKVDGGSVQSVVFYEVDFDNIAVATAQEVSDIITAYLSGATAAPSSGAVKIVSDSYGTSSSIQVTGGTANAVLSFSTSVHSGTDADDYFLINRIPEPDEVGVPATSNVQVDIFASTGSAPAAANVDIYVDGDLAVDGGVFQSGYDGPGSATSTPDAATRRFVIDPTSNFASDYEVSVQVIVSSGVTLDEKYYFTTQDLTEPGVSSVVAVGKKTIRVTYNEAVRQVNVSSEDDALRPTNYTIERNPPENVPAVDVVVSSVSTVSETVVELTTDIELSFGQPYLLTVENVRDLAGNIVSASLSEDKPFDAFAPAAPDGRSFSLWEMLPQMNRAEDLTHDLLRWTGVIQEPTNVLLSEIDGFSEILDPDFASEQFLDAMLFDLGNPFSFVELEEIDKRRLVQVLVQIYKLKGTSPGIIDVVRFFLGVEVTIVAFNTAACWTLGTSFAYAQLISGLKEPFALSDGETLTIKVDDADTDETVTFNTAEFDDIANATAAEVAAVIAAEADEVTAASMPDGRVLLQREVGGEGTSIRVTGGTAADEFNFPLLISELAETYGLVEGETLVIRVWAPGSPPTTTDLTVTFNTSEFADITRATAAEVAAVIATEAAGVGAEAMDSGHVGIHLLSGSNTLIWVIGGTAANKFLFPSRFVSGSGAESSWASELGEDSYLTVRSGPELYSFEIHSSVDLTADQIDRINLIANYMKPAHTHLVRIVTPSIEVTYDHVELGFSELGRSATDPGTWTLH